MSSIKSNCIGVFTFLLILIELTIGFGTLFIVNIPRALFPTKAFKRYISSISNKIGDLTVYGLKLILLLMHGNNITVFDDNKFDKNVWYMAMSNHQSWADIFILLVVAHKRIPLLKFFMKKELKWIPFIYLANKTLNMPFVNRHSKKEIELDPSLGACYRHLAEITKLDNSDGIDVHKIVQEGLEQPHLTEDFIKHVSFAWAKINDGQKNYTTAFKAYKRGNDIKSRENKYRKSDSDALFKLLTSSYNADFLSHAANSGLTEAKPIFILGMPRSGTTLVEQIISSHSDVTGAGELSYMADQAKQFKSGLLAFHKLFPKMDQSQWQDIGQAYLNGLNGYDEGRLHITDKMPHNFLNIGMISKLLPKARIIHCKRHPVANCLSIYKAYFGGKNSHSYAYNLKDLAHYHNLYENLMAHWRQVLPGRFYEVSYEQLTSNQEPESRQLIEYCGLDWQDACLDFYKTKRKVKTASAFQVRQPMHNQSVDLWKRYGEALQPLLDDLYIPEEYRD